jgi:hypothetical protein
LVFHLKEKAGVDSEKLSTVFIHNRAKLVGHAQGHAQSYSTLDWGVYAWRIQQHHAFRG